MTLTTEEREACIANMAAAGQMLARQWGHQEWSDSWAHIVAETMLREVVSDATAERVLRAYHGSDWPSKWPTASERTQRSRMKSALQAGFDPCQ